MQIDRPDWYSVHRCTFCEGDLLLVECLGCRRLFAACVETDDIFAESESARGRFDQEVTVCGSCSTPFPEGAETASDEAIATAGLRWRIDYR